MKLAEYLSNNRIIMDGAMGTYFDKIKTMDIIAEEGNMSCPDIIKGIHKEYIKAGARFLRTNTFAVNMSLFDNKESVEKNIEAACHIANEAVEECRKEGVLGDSENVYIGADIGTVLLEPEYTKKELLEEYKFICDCFIAQGLDIFVFETQAEIEPITEIVKYVKEKNNSFVLVQFSLDRTGYTKSGVSLKSIIKTMENEENVDAYGFNCGMSSLHLYQMLDKVNFSGKKIISALPNASYTSVIRGKTFYSNNVPYYVDNMDKVESLGIRILGGCCGTTPEYISNLVLRLKDKAVSSQKICDDLQEEKVLNKQANLLMDRLNSLQKVIMVELDPPFGDDVKSVIEGARYLKGKGTDIITLSDSPLGRARMESALLAAKVKEETGMMVMPHISCRDRNTIALRGMFLGLSAYGINNLLIVTGDPVQKGDKIKQVYEYNSIRLMNYLKTMNEEVFVSNEMSYGGALNYSGVNKEAIVKRMKDKMEAGASYFLTQPVYSKEDIDRIEYLKKETDAKIIVGIMPLVSHKNAQFIHNEMPGINVPDEIMERYKENLTRDEYEEIAEKVSLEIIDSLKDVADGYYFMTPFNRYKLIQRIIDKII